MKALDATAIKVTRRKAVIPVLVVVIFIFWFEQFVGIACWKLELVLIPPNKGPRNKNKTEAHIQSWNDRDGITYYNY